LGHRRRTILRSLSRTIAPPSECHPSPPHAAQRNLGYAEVERTLVQRARGEPWYSYFPVPDEDTWEFFRTGYQQPYDPTTHCDE
jgi:hypothetical protein